jgi:uncharacterized protein YbaR (Trm112 family)/SAM-dependent methyltransferase
MSLYDILACPNCQIRIDRYPDQLCCNKCQSTFPIIQGVPVMFPDGKLPEIVHQDDLNVLNSYNPWLPRLMLQSLLDDQIVLEVGSGNMALDDPCIIRMDVMLSPYVDLVADVHALPFLPESIDFIFSLAVFEHLHHPFQAAESIYKALKDGGYIYHECNFVFGYHGFPHHYFNASMQGMEQIFKAYTPLRKGVAPYQMPSFAVNNVLGTYLQHTHAGEFEENQETIALLHQVINANLRRLDGFFSEAEALNIAAGTYYAGMKKKDASSTCIPKAILEVWAGDVTLSRRFPHPGDITRADNLLLWAKQEGGKLYPEIDSYLSGIVRFSKRGPEAPWDRSILHSFPVIEPVFNATANPMPEKKKPAFQHSLDVLLTEGPRSFAKKLLRRMTRILDRK